MRRTTRSQSRQAFQPAPDTSTPIRPPILLKNTTSAPNISVLSNNFTSKTTGLSRSSATLLNNKRSKLRASNSRLRRFFQDFHATAQPQLIQAFSATLVFAQEEAGTAVCISPSGLLLTCSHCVAEDTETALSPTNAHWLIFATGEVVRAICVAWDSHRDLTLLQITHAEPPTTASPSLPHTAAPLSPLTFAHATISPSPSLPLPTPLICIGHPGSEDLEAPTPGQPTGYDVLHISEGVYRGLAVGQDPQDNSEIGALMHDCWTYWGHSGAPVLERGTGLVVGLHSSWDDETDMRRGVPGEAVRAFLGERTGFGEGGGCRGVVG